MCTALHNRRPFLEGLPRAFLPEDDTLADSEAGVRRVSRVCEVGVWRGGRGLGIRARAFEGGCVMRRRPVGGHAVARVV